MTRVTLACVSFHFNFPVLNQKEERKAIFEKKKKREERPPRSTTIRDGSKNVFSSKKKMLQVILQQLRPKKMKTNCKKKDKKPKTLDPEGRTPPFRRLTCNLLIIYRFVISLISVTVKNCNFSFV